ncbi:MAG: cold shock and DUF1294 domain-containing protein [Oceanospirillaceae bacterium]
MRENMKVEGKIISWNDDKGYGFASTQTKGSEIFVHIKDFEPADYRPCVEQLISFDITEREKGKPKAESILFRGARLQRKTAKRKSSVIGFSLCIVLLFSAFLAYGVMTNKLVLGVVVTYAVLSLYSYYLYAKDKAAARVNKWRISEATLQFWALCGGWPGAILAQATLNHKRKKTAFMVTFYAILILHIALLNWAYSAQGNLLLRSEWLNLQFWLSGTGYFDLLKVWWWKLNQYIQ